MKRVMGTWDNKGEERKKELVECFHADMSDGSGANSSWDQIDVGAWLINHKREHLYCEKQLGERLWPKRKSQGGEENCKRIVDSGPRGQRWKKSLESR